MQLFVQRPFDNDDTLKVIECVTCDWYCTYNDVLWTSNDMPDEQRTAFDQVKWHARRHTQTKARIVRGWRA
jgi:hypothetical protein